LSASESTRVVWSQDLVVDVRDAAFAARTYREHADTRALLNTATDGRRVAAACEIGAGYGRMTCVLTEFADRVVGVERERHFAAEAAQLYPAISFVHVPSLHSFPLQSASVDLVLTFTVLQHLIEPIAAAAAREIVRVLRPGGHALICEETDPQHRDGAVDDPNGICTIGRVVPAYQQLFDPLRLVTTQPRRIEPTYARRDVGTYMLFRAA
jgi:SAM-dependent methyltransferase